MITPRAIDDQGSLLGEDLRALRAAPGQNVDLHAGLARLTLAIGATMPPGLEQGPVAGAGAPVGAPGFAAAIATKKLAVLLVTTAIAGAAATGWVATRPAPPHPAYSEKLGSPSAAMTSPASVDVPPCDDPPTIVPVPPPTVVAPPAVVKTRVRTAPFVPPKVEPVAKPAALVVPPADRLLDEVRLLARTRAALPGDPKQALRLAQQARTDFPLGSLVEDREALAVFARAGMGEYAVAAAEAKNFLVRFPQGPYTAKMQAIADGRPLTP